jgi:virginiamycin B lyase
MHASRVLALALVALLLSVSAAVAAPAIVEFPLPVAGGSPRDIVTGPDGNLWVARHGAIHRVTLAGFVTQFPLPDPNAGAEGIVVGPDGRLWFAEFDKPNEFGRIGVDGTFAMVSFVTNGQLQDFVLGPDGNMWATVPFQGARVTKFSPSGAVLNDYSSGAEREPREIVSGPLGALWLFETRDTAPFPDRVAKLTTNGVLTEFLAPVAQHISGIAVGSDGNLWTTETIEPSGPTLAVRTTPTGTRAQFDLAPGLNFGRIAPGPDGNLWATLPGAGEIARITTNGAVDRYPLPSAMSQPDALTTGPDGNLWVVQQTPPQLARVTPEPPGTGPVPGAGGAGPPTVGPPPLTSDLDAPAVTGLRADPKVFAVGRAATPTTGVAARRKRVRRGTTFRYTLSEAATASLRIDRGTPGRRLRGTCRKPPQRGKRQGRKCTRYKAVGTLTRTSKAGANAVAFSGRIGRRKLAPGNYRVVATARDDAGNVTGRPQEARFRVLRP